MVHIRARRSRLLLLLAALTMAASVSQVAGALPALALGPGGTCVFFAPSGAYDLGHTGWGYQIGGTSQWIYGATENESGQNQPPGHDIGYWDRQGSFNQMLNTFNNPSIPTLNRIGSGYYTQYKCYYTSTSSVGAPVITTDETPLRPFSLGSAWARS